MTEIFEYHTRKKCLNCNSVQDYFVSMTKRNEVNFIIEENCLTCGETFLSKFSAMQLVEKMTK